VSDAQEILDKHKKFTKERDWDKFQTPRNLVMALSAEVGELVELFMWLSDEQAESLQPHQHKAAAEEIGDVFIYLLRLSDVLGIDLIKTAQEKMKMNNEKHILGKVKSLDEIYPKKR